LLLTCLSYAAYTQDQPDAPGDVLHFPSRLFSRIQGKTAQLDQQLTKQTEKYLDRMARQEVRLQKKLYKVDSAAAKSLFAGSLTEWSRAKTTRHSVSTSAGLAAIKRVSIRAV